MANEQNLLKGDDIHKFTLEEASKGGKASGEARRKKRDLRLALEQLLERDFTDKNGNTFTGTVGITTKLFQQAMNGNIHAFETIRDTVGQRPVERIMISDVDQEVVKEVEEMVLNDEE
jgi:hypothetical protein